MRNSKKRGMNSCAGWKKSGKARERSIQTRRMHSKILEVECKNEIENPSADFQIIEDNFIINVNLVFSTTFISHLL